MSTHLLKRQIAKCGQAITVLHRSLDESGYDSSQPVITFSTVDTPSAIVKTIESVRGGSKLFDGIQIVEDATHVFCLLYTATLGSVERQNYFIDVNNKRMKVLAVTNIDEKNKVLAIQATERGDATKEAAKA